MDRVLLYFGMNDMRGLFFLLWIPQIRFIIELSFSPSLLHRTVYYNLGFDLPAYPGAFEGLFHWFIRGRKQGHRGRKLVFLCLKFGQLFT